MSKFLLLITFVRPKIQLNCLHLEIRERQKLSTYLFCFSLLLSFWSNRIHSRVLSSPESLHTRSLAQFALGFHNMTVRSEEEFSPKHRGIQTDTEATVIAPHPEFNSRGGWGHQKCFADIQKINGVGYRVHLVQIDSSLNLLSRCDLTSRSVSQSCETVNNLRC